MFTTAIFAGARCYRALDVILRAFVLTGAAADAITERSEIAAAAASLLFAGATRSPATALTRPLNRQTNK